MWWGYLHSSGQIICKRWLGDHKDYTSDVADNEFVIEVVKPFFASNREEALEIIKEKLK